MTTQTEALKMALEAMQQVHGDYHGMPNRVGPKEAFEMMRKAITATKEALAQQSNEQVEPVAKAWGFLMQWNNGKTQIMEGLEDLAQCEAMCEADEIITLLYTHPPVPTAQPKEPEQEPVAVVDANDEGYWADILPDRNVKVGQFLYTTPYVATPRPQRPSRSDIKPLTDDEIWKFWCSRPEVPEGEDDSMEAEFIAAVRRVLAAHGIKE